jgi:hypothetical protein
MTNSLAAGEHSFASKVRTARTEMLNKLLIDEDLHKKLTWMIAEEPKLISYDPGLKALADFYPFFSSFDELLKEGSQITDKKPKVAHFTLKSDFAGTPTPGGIWPYERVLWTVNTLRDKDKDPDSSEFHQYVDQNLGVNLTFVFQMEVVPAALKNPVIKRTGHVKFHYNIEGLWGTTSVSEERLLRFSYAPRDLSELNHKTRAE